jgi:hypothetical protein
MAEYILLDAHHLSKITKLKTSLVWGGRKNAKEAKKNHNRLHTYIQKTRGKKLLEFQSASYLVCLAIG